MTTHPSLITALPAGMYPGGGEILTVRPHEVERGDQIIGLRTVIDSILYDGNTGRWLYVDAKGVIICARPGHAVVQVLRGGLSSHDTNGHGIKRRHLQIVH